MKKYVYVKPMLEVVHIDTEGIMQNYSKVKYGNEEEKEIPAGSDSGDDPYGGYDI